MTAPRRMSLRALISVCVLVVSLAAANWGYVYHEVMRAKDQAGEVPILESDLAELSRSQIYAAGWPTKFYIQIQYDDLPPLAQLSWKNLAINLGLGCIGIAAILLYEWRLHRGRNGGAPAAKRNLSLADLIICTGLLASVIAYWRSLELVTESEMAVSREIVAAGGTTVETVQLPQIVARVIPEPLRWRIKRVSEVTLNGPSSELLAKAMALPYLTRLSIGGGDYDLKLLNQLATKPLLSALRVSGRRLDSQTVASLAALKQLQALNLMRTNITAKALTALGDMPRLQSINLIHTDVVLAELGTPSWSKTVRTLQLPHPVAGQGDQLTLESWPELRSLTCNEYDERLNTQPVVLTLKQLPKLHKLSLDALQLFELHLDNLPELAEVQPLHSQWETRVSNKEVVPGTTWIRKLTSTATPKLRSLSLSASAIEELRFSEPLAMRLKFSGDRILEALYTQGPGSGKVSILFRKPAWIEGWGHEVGPRELDFSGLDLGGVNLAPLTACKHVQSIDFSNCRITAEQLQQLSGMDSLEYLNVEGCLQDGQTIAWLASHLPNLRRLGCDPFSLHELSLENHPNLEKILLDPYLPLLAVGALKVVAMPSLKESFDLSPELAYLHIDDAPSLTGLSTRGPWPKQAVLRGVRDLTYFAAGGDRLDDAVAEAVLACEKLHTLTLAYSSVSPEVLAKVGTLKGLTYLALSGSKVDDAVIQQWQPLSGLRTLHLDDTAISDKTIDYILSCKDLEHVSLRNTQITEQGLAQLSKLEKLWRVDCGGDGWSPKKMSAVCSIPGLRVLDLSDTKLTLPTLAVLQQNTPPKLEQLILRNGQADGPALVQLARQRSEIVFDLTDTDVDSDALVALSDAQRVSPPSTIEGELQQILSDYMRYVAQRRWGSDRPAYHPPNAKHAKGMIDPRVFVHEPLGASGDTLSQFDPPASLTGPSQSVRAPSMSLPTLIGYAIGNFSKTFSAFASQGGNDVVEY